MVGLEVIEDDGGDLVVIGNRLQTAKEGRRKIDLDRVDHGHAVTAAHDIGVVAGAVGGAQDDVEVAQVGVEGADPVHPGASDTAPLSVKVGGAAAPQCGCHSIAAEGRSRRSHRSFRVDHHALGAQGTPSSDCPSGQGGRLWLLGHLARLSAARTVPLMHRQAGQKSSSSASGVAERAITSPESASSFFCLAEQPRKVTHDAWAGCRSAIPVGSALRRVEGIDDRAFDRADRWRTAHRRSRRCIRCTCLHRSESGVSPRRSPVGDRAARKPSN
jgi:hypothetical protein